MAGADPNGRGELFHTFFSSEKTVPPMEWILSSSDVEVYFVPDIGERTDPEFWMLTKDGVLVNFAYTGDLTAVRKISGSHNSSSLETVVEMDPKHRFHLNRSSLPVNGIVDKPEMAPEQLLEELIDYSYRKAKSVENSALRGMARNFQVLTYDAIVSRFKLLDTLQSSTDIIPDQSPRTIFVKAGDGCVMKCNYCPEGTVKFVPYTESQFRNHIEITKNALKDILGKELITRMNEGFINISDIGWLDMFNKAGKTDLTSLRAAELMREYFPWLEKIGSFVGSSTALRLSGDDYGNVELGKKKYSSRFFRALRGDNLINRLYLGLETAHTEGSHLLNKPISYDEKLTAARLVQDAGIRLKVIAQLGVLGKGFYPLGKDMAPENFVSWEKATDQTAEWINEIRPYRVLEAVYQPSPNLPINRLIREGRIVSYDNPKQIEAERERLRKGIKVNSNEFRIDGKYEDFLPAHLTGSTKQVIVH